jgi:peptidoglycan hydrolase-like protein with peptidoglycan-binding domain
MSLVIPVHEQLYPKTLLPHRVEEYVRDGAPPTSNRAYAIMVTGQQTYDAVLAAQLALSLANIDARYFVGTCFHEAGCSNEWDTEIATVSSPSGFQSVGAYQIGDEEARRFGFTLADMLDFDKATRCMIQLAEANRTQLRAFAKLGPGTPDPDYTDENGVLWKGGTMRAYLGIAHNHGTGYARMTIAQYGMNWAAYKARNPNDNIVSHGYGEDCVTGGSHYPGTSTVPPVVVGSRVLKLRNPHMKGTDVAELQKHLKIGADGDFGPATDTAVRAFQKAAFLVIDGVVGEKTWAALLAT